MLLQTILLPTWPQIFFLVLAVVALFFALRGIKTVDEGTARIVERLGRYHRTLDPGINLIVAGLDRIKRGFQITAMQENGEVRRNLVDNNGGISLKEEMLDPGPFKTIAADNAILSVDSLIYFRIIDPRQAVYAVYDLGLAMLRLMETTLRQEIAKLDSDAVLSARSTIGTRVQEELERATEAWGTKVVRVELQSIDFEKEVQERLSRARAAELERRALVTAQEAQRDQLVIEAEGKKRAEILQAEGVRQAAILRAEGEKEATMLTAQATFERQRLDAEARFLVESRQLEGRARGFAAIAGALTEKAEVLVALEALKAQGDVAASLGNSNNTLILPAEVAGLFGIIGALQNGLGFLRKQNTPRSDGAPHGEAQ